MTYEECETQLRPGDTVLFYSDGLVEAHDPDREMFGFPRLREMLASHPSDDAGELVDFLLDRLAMFTGPAWEQEDDITLVTVHRAGNPARLTSFAREMLETEDSRSAGEWGIVTSFSLPSEVGNERVAMDRVREALEPLGLPTRTLDNLGTAVAEATMNAMEHGNRYQADVPVAIAVEASSGAVAVSITDRGDNPIRLDSETPDLEKKLEMAQTPRGWGLFLIQNMVDDVQVSTGDSGHTIRLIVHREGVDDVTQSS
jgi:anti-sigma regulatory factor (Ser/Thr protein kinase)